MYKVKRKLVLRTQAIFLNKDQELSDKQAESILNSNPSLKSIIVQKKQNK